MALRRLLTASRAASGRRAGPAPGARGCAHGGPDGAPAVLCSPAEPACAGLARWPWDSGASGAAWPAPLPLAALSLYSQAAAQRLGPAAAPLAETAASPATYEVEVVTGDVRGAGSPAPAVLRLVGERGQSEEFVIGREEDEEVGFERGSKRRYTFPVGRPLGQLRRLFVQQLDAEEQPASCTGWFLHQIVVTAPDGSAWHFPCNSWIGRSDGDGLPCGTERNLIPCEVPHLETAAAPFLLPRPLRVAHAAVSIPHPEKLAEGGAKAVNRRHEGWGGEDAYFCAAGRHGTFGLGVADGVYMWKTRGIDSGAFSRALMQTAREAVQAGVADVVQLMQATSARIDRDSVAGSSTTCLILIDTLQGRLSSANLGDSGFLVLGPGGGGGLQVKYHSPQQEHQFGFPYQLGHHGSADTPDAAMLVTLPVVPGDLVIAGSDGLWDNVSVVDICAAAGRLLAEGARPPALAQRLAALAFEATLDKKRVTPYSLAATDAFDMVYSGGKKDDITVVVAHLT